MRYLLDTNVVSELRKPPRLANPNVVAWAARQTASDLFVSVITVMEVELGVALMERRDPRQGAILRAWFEQAIITDLSNQTLPMTIAVIRRTVPMHVPNPRPDRDAFIAATALEHGLTLVTRNTIDFRATGAVLLNPWNPASVDAAMR
ncbi:MAG: type II toxin-antitoxin system VapC family toxin [Micrococcales bacterium]|nr:type II toxin-antitoxin system VapC family toxin [Micrococcales bacterium]